MFRERWVRLGWQEVVSFGVIDIGNRFWGSIECLYLYFCCRRKLMCSAIGGGFLKFNLLLCCVKLRENSCFSLK